MIYLIIFRPTVIVNATTVAEQHEPGEENQSVTVAEQHEPGEENQSVTVAEQHEPGEENQSVTVAEQHEPGEENQNAGTSNSVESNPTDFKLLEMRKGFKGLIRYNI